MSACPHEGLFAAATPDLVRCPYPVYEHLRGEHPVHWVQALTPYAVTRHADVLDVLLRPADFSSTRQSGPGAATTELTDSSSTRSPAGARPTSWPSSQRRCR